MDDLFRNLFNYDPFWDGKDFITTTRSDTELYEPFRDHYVPYVPYAPSELPYNNYLAPAVTNFIINNKSAEKKLPEIKDVIFNPPATIVLWKDGTKTVVKCRDGDTYSKETGLALAICKKVYGNTGSYNDIFNRWIK